MQRILDRDSNLIVVLTIDDGLFDLPSSELALKGMSERQVQWLGERVIHYGAEFDIEEQARALSVFEWQLDNSVLPPSELVRLPEFFAAVPALVSRVKQMMRDEGRHAHRALWLAALDASVLFPQGTDFGTLRRLATLHLAAAVPVEVQVTDRGWNEAFDWANERVGGAPAIFDRLSGEGSSTLWRLRTDLAGQFLADHVLIDPVLDEADEGAFLHALLFEYERKDWEGLRALAESGHLRGFAVGTYFCGVVSDEHDGSFEAARAWYEMSIEGGYLLGEFDLALLLHRNGHTESVESLLRSGFAYGDLRCKSALCWLLELRGGQ